MKEDVARAWVADLRNPENKQTKEVLFDGRGFCCLGRLCVVAGRSFVRGDGNNYRVARTDDDTSLPSVVQRYAGVAHCEGTPRDDEYIKVGDGEYRGLAEANDAGRTFAEIADAIERDWRRL